jgi:magnesium transporter
MLSVLVQREGRVDCTDAVDPAWLRSEAGAVVWADIEAPEEGDRALLLDVFGIHELAVEDALSEIHHPKIESYDQLLYLILHGIAPRDNNGVREFTTQDVDFFIGPNFLVTVHHGMSRSILAEHETCVRRPGVFSDGPVGIAHRIIDRLVDHYGPEVDAIDDRLGRLEDEVFDDPSINPLKDLLQIKRDVATLRRLALPQRDAIGRLARREFPQITETLAYRFRDVYDQLVRISDQSILLQDRATSLVDAHLSNQSNRLNQVMKVLTVISTIFMPLSVLTGLWGMNVPLPVLPGGDPVQFWWVAGVMVAISLTMLWAFRRRRWL